MQRPTQRPVALRVIQFIQLRSISVQFIGEITTVWGTESNIGREGVREGGGGWKEKDRRCQGYERPELALTDRRILGTFATNEPNKFEIAVIS